MTLASTAAPVVGAVVMMIVGASLARAFGIVGAANLIRYRAKIDDPKDAVVMLATLSLGLACGVELYGLAVFATVFILAVLWSVESLEPELRKTFDLTVTTPDPAAQRSAVESILARYEIDYELRSAGDIMGGPPPLGELDKKRFADALDRLVTSLSRA